MSDRSWTSHKYHIQILNSKGIDYFIDKPINTNLPEEKTEGTLMTFHVTMTFGYETKVKTTKANEVK